MIEKLGYPKALLGVEKSLVDIADATFSAKDIPRRRVDIVCFTKGEARPLLLIECKALDLSEKSFRQVIGYNYYVKAPFVAVACESAILMGVFNPKTSSYDFMDGLLRFQDLERAL